MAVRALEDCSMLLVYKVSKGGPTDLLSLAPQGLRAQVFLCLRTSLARLQPVEHTVN